MFCPNCGKQIEDGNYNCAHCSWSWGNFEEKNIENINNIIVEDKESDNIEPIYSSNSETTITHNQLNTTTIDPTNNKNNKITAFILIGIIAAIIIGIIAYGNSDSYKIKKASELIIQGNCAEATAKIFDVYTPQATTIKNYINVELAKNTFIEHMKNNSFDEAKEAYSEFYYEILKFNEENEHYYLTEDLISNYNCYTEAFAFTNEYTTFSENTDSTGSSELALAILDVQQVMLNEVIKNKSSKYGTTYTLDELQHRIDTSESALEILRNYYFPYIEIDDPDILAKCNIFTDGINTSTLFSDSLEYLKNECSNEITSSQTDIYMSSFEHDDALYLKDPDPDFDFYVGTHLENIDEYNDTVTNTHILMNILKTDMLYSLITGQQSSSVY